MPRWRTVRSVASTTALTSRYCSTCAIGRTARYLRWISSGPESKFPLAPEYRGEGVSGSAPRKALLSETVKRWLILLATVALAGTVWAVHAASVRQRAREMRRSADEACGRFDFLAAHDRWLAYLEVHPKE